jgi:imidazolonepropionase
MTGCQIATMLPDGAPYGLIDDGAIVVEGREIRWVGPRLDLPQEFAGSEAMDLGGRLVTPGLIDAHSHVVYGGNRAKEFEMRLSGASYEEIAKAGGGILSTVTATRAATQEDLVAAALPRVDAMISEGVTTLEIKSGYGLTPDSELTMLRAARDIAEKRRLRVKTTYLAAHAVPPEFAGRADDYIDTVVLPTLRQAHGEGLVDAVDGFCEGIAFAPDQIARVFDLAKGLDLPVKLHAEQLSDLGGAALAASYGALSADHIEYLDDLGVAAMAKAGTIAVLLPGAFYTLKETQKPPVASLRKAGVPMAVATDCNPGSSPMTSLLLAMNMACTFFGLTPQEALAGTTRNAARALGLFDAGVIAAQKRADLAVWDVSHPAELAYTIGMNPLHARVFEGRFQ